ncbi:MAG: NAD(P)/FAD-dependent oxidoreductase [Terrimicrobiaceae bacterium]
MKIAIIGGGPAGLRAAELAAGDGAAVTVFDAKASVGRKFLVAGKGGLNLTKTGAPDEFAAQYRGGEIWPSLLKECDSEALRAWAAGLGVETFVASTGRVYPREMKAAPLLRSWVQRLRALGVQFAMHHRWTGISRDRRVNLTFAGSVTIEADAVVLALGGGSWPETGSDGGWVASLETCGVAVTPMQPANSGWEVNWPAALLAEADGLPLKNITARAGLETAAGELLITRYGLEGGAIYQLGPALRTMDSPELVIDFKPGVSVENLVRKLGLLRGNFLAEARQRWRLSDAAFVLLTHLAPQTWESAEALAQCLKAFPISLLRPRPIAEAISSAGGVRWDELDDSLMLKKLPGVFCAGEMIDWEAPTGGYLMQGCFATGTRAGKSARNWALEER